VTHLEIETPRSLTNISSRIREPKLDRKPTDPEGFGAGVSLERR
jgi:hypothetical protein